MVINWLRKLFHLCDHKWVIFDTRYIYNDEQTIVGTKYHMQCEKCGNIKAKRL